MRKTLSQNRLFGRLKHVINTRFIHCLLCKMYVVNLLCNVQCARIKEILEKSVQNIHIQRITVFSVTHYHPPHITIVCMMCEILPFLLARLFATVTFASAMINLCTRTQTRVAWAHGRTDAHTQNNIKYG